MVKEVYLYWQSVPALLMSVLGELIMKVQFSKFPLAFIHVMYIVNKNFNFRFLDFFSPKASGNNVTNGKNFHWNRSNCFSSLLTLLCMYSALLMGV